MTVRSLPRTPLLATAALLSGLAAQEAAAQADRAFTVIPAQAARITGSMTIDFHTRKASSSIGVDEYTIHSLTIADLMAYAGTIQREPERQMVYSIKIDVFNPANPSEVAREVAIIRGRLPIDSDGRYVPEEGDLRLDIVKGTQSSSPFGGVIQGRDVTRWWEISEQLQAAEAEARKLYSRTVNGRTVTISVIDPDPLSFVGLELPSGPFSFLPVTTVNGNLDYDYELGNWLTDANGLTFSYTVGDRSVTDRVTGSIRFAEEEGTFTDSAGQRHDYTSYYEYSLRFNEPVVAPEDAFFDGETSEQDFNDFFSDVSDLPGLYGRIYYNDSEDGCRMERDDAGVRACVGPTRSEVYYELRAVDLTYAQLGNWFKIDPLIAGPMNDE